MRGNPWCIKCTNGSHKIILPDDKRRSRTVIFFTKGGGLPGYSTLILLVPEYDWVSRFSLPERRHTLMYYRK
ncbi:uncharacterized protein BDW43DRAFT_219632 [Aspergillus alliaceus]|uniref:uncharacterized protein n=1 Tax=Petromyces alliaceus TaxID=209559 RepID=UPI0012A5F8EC|nr:uncharacterized protein BDW43DRAFT_219632 [Aspergillus alliaceus]KAB8228292.1 hypothetical protein BDW43DRAFT_219632 [Aspergillus alliaceus]